MIIITIIIDVQLCNKRRATNLHSENASNFLICFGHTHRFTDFRNVIIQINMYIYIFFYPKNSKLIIISTVFPYVFTRRLFPKNLHFHPWLIHLNRSYLFILLLHLLLFINADVPVNEIWFFHDYFNEYRTIMSVRLF